MAKVGLVERNGALSKNSVHVWYNAIRPFSYPASIVPVIVGTMLAWQVGKIDVLLFFLVLIASVAIHMGTNLANEYLDYVQGVDKADSLGPAGVLIKRELQPKQILWASGVTFALGTVIGFYLAFRAGWFILLIGVASVLAAWFYTAKPLALGYSGLGEPEVFFFMGPIMVIGSYYVQVKSLAWAPLLVSLPIGLLVMAILHVNNLRDVVQDDERNRLTWVVLAYRRFGAIRGKSFSIALYCTMIVGAYLIILVLAGFGVVPTLALLTVLTAPKGYGLIKFVSSSIEGKPLSAAVRGTARFHMLFGTTLALAYLANILILHR
jgi:1,4-dihydroxy-2-naphthoate octaprenyltransferase